jgi:DsbC/DsbD-like thiol-disulfide interchange protein
VKAVEVVWPAPRRLEDPGGVTFGYEDGLVLPLKVTPERPGAPVELGLSLHFGVCKDICIPAQARARLPLPADGASAHDALLRVAMARAPKPQALGEGALAVTDVTPGPGRLRVSVRAPDGARPQLFAEAPDGWYLGAPEADADGAFAVVVLERPKEASGPVPLTFTLVAGESAVETRVSLDAGALSR